LLFSFALNLGSGKPGHDCLGRGMWCARPKTAPRAPEVVILVI